jgi:hypothetical protein
MDRLPPLPHALRVKGYVEGKRLGMKKEICTRVSIRGSFLSKQTLMQLQLTADNSSRVIQLAK